MYMVSENPRAKVIDSHCCSKAVVKELHSGKALGIDKIFPEMLKALGVEFGLG